MGRFAAERFRPRPGRARSRLSLILVCVALAASPTQAFAVEDVNFGRDVLPLLADRCFHCHGPDEEMREAGLRLDVPDGPDGPYEERAGFRALTPGSLEKSEVWYRLTTEEESERMPPVHSHKRPLSAAEKDVVRRWILQGASYERHWSFVPPRAPAIPEVTGGTEGLTPIDRFVRARQEQEGRIPTPPADRRTLIRRVTLDLIGLPPTRDEIRAFLEDPTDDAYERLVDDLLARPQYAEHMARYWLDLVRFADTNGMHHDHYREMSPYRDWVIRAFEQNLSYDRFIAAQLAGDLLDEPTADDLIASGFHRLHLIIDVGTALPEESYTKNVIDRVNAFGTAFLGLTVGCAVCHDHKYDPIEQRDYYQLFAFFNNLDAEPETGPRRGTDFRRGLQPPYVDLPSAEQASELQRIDEELGAIEAELAAQSAATADADAAASAQESGVAQDAQARAATAEALHQRQKELRERRDRLLLEIPAAMVMKERGEPRPAAVLVRGQYDVFGEAVEPDTPTFLPPMKATAGRKSRRDLAHWLVSPEHPLTARVQVNRLWQQFFGVGLVKTSEDFGIQGERPSHPDLLDHLAVEFVRSGWDVKALVRSIVLSATYRQSSSAPAVAFAEDPQNRWLARGSRFRLDAEVIRDQILVTSGLLSPHRFGPSVKPPQPAGVWKAVTLPDSNPRVFVADEGEDIFRRSLYTFWKRALPPPQMTILDAPSREYCVARRERTNTATQALLLLNEQQYLRAAGVLAAHMLGEETSDEARMNALYETLTARFPEQGELRELAQLLADLRQYYTEHDELATELCDDVSRVQTPVAAALRTRLDSGELAAVEFAAWTVLASTLYNLDAVRTRE